MSNCSRAFRFGIKKGIGVPTIPVSSDHQNGDWIDTDIYEGEQYLDTDTGMVYTRSGTEIVTSDGADNIFGFLYIPNYSAIETYDDTDNTFVLYNGLLWRWINIASGSGVTPVNGSDWSVVSPTLLTHERNKDSLLQSAEHDIKFKVGTVSFGGFDIPSAVAEIEDSGITYNSGIIDYTLAGEDVKCLLAAMDATNTGHNINVTSSEIEIKHINAGVTSASIVVSNGSIKIKGLPTSSVGLATNEIWNDSGTLKIIP